MPISKSDARKQSRDVLHERRREVVALHQANVPVMQIVERSGLSWYAVNAAIAHYRTGGESALRPAARGRKKNTGRRLNDVQEAEVLQCIEKLRPGVRTHRPLLWDRVAVAELIELKYKFKLSDRALGNYLVRWGLALKKSKVKPSDRCSVEIRNWLNAHYTEMERQAKEFEADIYWINKPTKIDSDLGHSSVTANEEDLDAGAGGPTKNRSSMISVSNNQGKLLWAINTGGFSPARQIKFMNALIRNRKRKRLLVLIRNDQTSFRSGDFTDWLQKHSNVVRMLPDAINSPLAADALKHVGMTPYLHRSSNQRMGVAGGSKYSENALGR